MYCHNCGKEISENAAVCLNCGAEVISAAARKNTDSNSAGWWWLGFFIPVVGVLIWALCGDTAPKMAKKAGIGALVGAILGAIVAVVLFLAPIVFAGIFAFSELL